MATRGGLIDRVVSAAAGSAALAEFVTLLEHLNRRPGERFHVLTYHRVDEPAAHPTLHPGLISATPADFEAQMAYLAGHYDVISMVELLAVFAAGASLPRRAVLVTFDDGYRDFAVHAWPILRHHRLPVTLFLPTAYPDRPERAFWWDRLYAALRGSSCSTVDAPMGRLSLATPGQRERAFRYLKEQVKTLPHTQAMSWVDQTCAALGGASPEPWILGWSEVRRLAAEGVTLGAHTRTHPMLNRIPPDEARAEVAGARADLAREVGSTPPILAYPGGGVSDAVVQVLAEDGIELAFTTWRGGNDRRRADPLRLRRVGIGSRATLAVFRARLLPWSLEPALRRPSPRHRAEFPTAWTLSRKPKTSLSEEG